MEKVVKFDMEDRIKIENINDFTKLFLSIYSKKKADCDNIVYFSKYFNEILVNVMNVYKDNIPSLFDENEEFKIVEFLKSMKFSIIKYYWRDDFKYNLKNNPPTVSRAIDISAIACGIILRGKNKIGNVKGENKP